MSGDVHVRFCERLGGRFPGATRHVACFEHEADARADLPAIDGANSLKQFEKRLI